MNRSYTELLGALIWSVYRRHAGAKVLFFPETNIRQARFFQKKRLCATLFVTHSLGFSKEWVLLI